VGALLVYWFNILLLGLTLYWTYATRARLLADDVPAEIHPAVVRRIVVTQSLYACGGRALLSQHVLQHRHHRSGAGELCHCPTLLLGLFWRNKPEE